MGKHKCFMTVGTGTYRKFLRRHAMPDGRNGLCTQSIGYHDVRYMIEDRVRVVDPMSGDSHPHDDPGWPTVCDCDYVFSPRDKWQVFWEELYESQDDGTIHTLREAPVGATWRAPWYEPAYSGPDGMSFVAATPGGQWLLDKGDWIRTGNPPRFTMDKPVRFSQGSDESAYSCRLEDGYIIDL